MYCGITMWLGDSIILLTIFYFCRMVSVCLHLFINYYRCIVTGLLPVAGLSYLNYRIYDQIKHRRGQFMNHRGSNHKNQTHAQKVEEKRQAFVLFAIVILFVVCHVLR